MARRDRTPSGRSARGRSREAPSEGVDLRIIGGRFRGRKLISGSQPRVRPMKDRVREAVFNLLGPGVVGKHAIDLFAGSGALGLEALSRGAAGATLIEQHFPTAAIIRRNVATLGVEDIAQIVTADVFRWWQRHPELPASPWIVFCSPPWDFFVERTQDMLALICGMIESAPAHSIFTVEADQRFDFALLPEADAWDIRAYAPAVVGIHDKPSSE